MKRTTGILLIGIILLSLCADTYAKKEDVSSTKEEKKKNKDNKKEKLNEKEDPKDIAKTLVKQRIKGYKAGPRTVSKEELFSCDGSDPQKPILVSIKGRVYDVTNSKMMGPGGKYHMFAGKIATRAFAMEDYSKDVFDMGDDISGLNAQQLEALESWINSFETSKKYYYVGPLEGSPFGQSTNNESNVQKTGETETLTESNQETTTENVDTSNNKEEL
eukprot:TRINITY_DN2104_c0_g1_i1.p1 TRINITY_DN2104_c0_g1~~TRINITY_DN2104_c0_g1_i1.p1  ORF type:complete len:218 (-),score=70.27 TRINITY_DN2104_c0_g1_i1:21-674(-)